MSEPYVGEIRMFAGNFAPRGWAFCDGQLQAVSQNDALFSLFGTIYGGDGRTTFALPDLRGHVPIHAGSGPGLSPRALGAKNIGAERVTLTTNQIPSHNHAYTASTAAAAASTPAGNVVAQTTYSLYGAIPPTTPLATQAVGNTGGSQPHPNMMPFLCINFIVALYGIYPSRQ